MQNFLESYWIKWAWVGWIPWKTLDYSTLKPRVTPNQGVTPNKVEQEPEWNDIDIENALKLKDNWFNPDEIREVVLQAKQEREASAPKLEPKLDSRENISNRKSVLQSFKEWMDNLIWGSLTWNIETAWLVGSWIELQKSLKEKVISDFYNMLPENIKSSVSDYIPEEIKTGEVFSDVLNPLNKSTEIMEWTQGKLWVDTESWLTTTWEFLTPDTFLWIWAGKKLITETPNLLKTWNELIEGWVKELFPKIAWDLPEWEKLITDSVGELLNQNTIKSEYIKPVWNLFKAIWWSVKTKWSRVIRWAEDIKKDIEITANSLIDEWYIPSDVPTLYDNVVNNMKNIYSKKIIPKMEWSEAKISLSQVAEAIQNEYKTDIASELFKWTDENADKVIAFVENLSWVWDVNLLDAENIIQALNAAADYADNTVGWNSFNKAILSALNNLRSQVDNAFSAWWWELSKLKRQWWAMANVRADIAKTAAQLDKKIWESYYSWFWKVSWWADIVKWILSKDFSRISEWFAKIWIWTEIDALKDKNRLVKKAFDKLLKTKKWNIQWATFKVWETPTFITK